MARLWYGSDEVTEFHPIVEECLHKALSKAKLENKYVLKHHHGQFTSGIPDFVLLDKRTGDFVCIIEIKKTPSDVFYFGSGYQTKSYVDELYPLRWKHDCKPHFCVTNIELTQFYCWRKNSSLIGCLLTGSPHDCGTLSDNGCYARFTDLFVSYFIRIDQLQEPEFSMHLEAISESFNETFYTISKILGVNLVRMARLVQADAQIKESIIYELLRFAFYYYIKESYELLNSPYREHFREFNIPDASNMELLNVIEENFSKAMEIDFKDLLRNYDSPDALIPHKLKKDKELCGIFNNFIQTLRDNAAQGIKKNNNLMQFVSLLTSEIYDKQEMHALGKIMSDETLSNILAEFAITSKRDLAIDPCCGDGNLLISAYNRLKKLDPNLSHNELLRQIYGIEIDANLVQLAAFKLICNDLSNINKDTLTNLDNADLFETSGRERFDALVMNPPFLRNEDMTGAVKAKYLQNIEKTGGKKSFIRDAAQPNLYFYFIEKSLIMLKRGGNASIILMTKFLNNKDGEYLKRFLLPHLKAIITYPPDFFRGFAVTTCIILLNKNGAREKVSFLRAKDANLLSDLANVNKIIESDDDKVTDMYSIVHVKRSSLNPAHNWRLYLTDPQEKFREFESAPLLKYLRNHFDVILRGTADNCGGSRIVYPYSSNNPLSDEVGGIEEPFVGFGMKINKLMKGRRKIILTKNCLNAQRGVLFPSRYDCASDSGIPKNVPNAKGLRNYCKLAKLEKINGKKIDLKRVMNSSFNSIVTPQIIIPRADREKHIVYCNPFIGKPILMSTNFFYLDKLKNKNPELSEKEQILFITAFLNSTYGQIQFEVHGNNQEGARKMEGFMIEKIKVPDLTSMTKQEVQEVIRELEKLNSSDVGFIGTEEKNPRKNLDLSIAKIIFKRSPMRFKSYESLNEHFEDFLEEIVLDRVK